MMKNNCVNKSFKYCTTFCFSVADVRNAVITIFFFFSILQSGSKNVNGIKVQQEEKEEKLMI